MAKQSGYEEILSIWERLKKAAKSKLDSKATLRGPATEEGVTSLEKAIGQRLPDDVRASYLVHDGQEDNGNDLLPSEFAGLGCGFVLMSAEASARDWQMLKELLDGGDFAGRRAEPDAGVRDDHWHPGWVPIASDGGGDYLCVDLAPEEGGAMGQIIGMQDNDRKLLGPSFARLLLDLAEHYEQSRQ
jgi:cell wall assembly regulator SMI1